jgi:hypothetical protein
METGKLTGTLRITKPLLYIFPSREGDSAYFTLNGYSILINGGYDRMKPCFWSFVNMLAQIDSILITHSDSDALGGLGSFFAKKLVDPEIKPNVLTVLGNLIASSGYKSSSETIEHAQLAANLIAAESSSGTTDAKSTPYVDLIIDSIERLKIQLMPLTKSSDQAIAKHNGVLNNFAKYEHINLYYKLGQGSLDLYVLSPFANSTDYKEFVQQQRDHLAKHQTHQKSQLNPGQLFKNIPMSHVNSAVVLLVWMPHVTKQTVLDGENNALRLLFTGNAPQHVVLNALDKVKDFEVLTSPVYKIKPAPEPVHHQVTKKPTSSSSAPSATSTKTTNGSSKSTSSANSSALSANSTKTTNSSKPTSAATTTRPSLAAKPPLSKTTDKSKVEVNGAAKPTKPDALATKGAKVESNGATKPKPKSAPVPSKPIEKKPIDKKPIEKKTTTTSTVAKKPEAPASTRQSLSKTSAPTASTTTTKPATGRLSSQGTRAPVPAAKKNSKLCQKVFIKIN